MARKPISKRVRFEVFKRDSFKCQYCGAEAPDALLQIDHIHPVSLGGDNHIVNLITSCWACNNGKSDTPLGDSTAVEKSRAQMEELQARREQMQLMMQWREGLAKLREEEIDRIAGFWNSLAPGMFVSEYGKQLLRKWYPRFSIAELTNAMQATAETYLKIENGKATKESWEKAFGLIPAFCVVARQAAKDPAIRDLYYIRGILRRRLQYCNDSAALSLMKTAIANGMDVEEIRIAALTASSWTHFTNLIS